MSLNVDAVYVMHYRPLTERLEHLEKMMSANGIPFTLFDMEPDDELDDYFVDDLLSSNAHL